MSKVSVDYLLYQIQSINTVLNNFNLGLTNTSNVVYATQSQVNGIVTSQTADESNISALQTTISNIQSTLTNLQQQLNSVESGAAGINFNTPNVVIASDSNSHTVLKQVDNTLVADAGLAMSKIAGLQNLLTQISTSATAYTNTQVSALQSQVTAINLSLTTTIGKQNTDESNISALSTQAGVFNNSLNNVTTIANNNTVAITGFSNRLTNDETNITNQGSSITALTNKVLADEGIVSNLSTTVGTIQTKQAVDETNISTLTTGLANANGNISNINSTLTSYGTSITSLNTSFGNLQATVTGISNSQTNDETSIASHTASISALTTRISGDETTITTANTNIASLQAGLSAVQNRCTNIENYNNSNTTNVNGILSRLSTDETNITSNNSAITALQGRATADEGNITTNTNSITTLQSSLATTNNNVNTANNNITTNSTAITALQSRATTDENAITALQTRATADELLIGTANTNISNLTIRVTNAEGNITASQNNIATNITNINTINTNLTTLTNRLTTDESNFNNGISTLTTSNNNNSNAITSLQNRATNDETIINTHTSQISILQNPTFASEPGPPSSLLSKLAGGFSTYNTNNIRTSYQGCVGYWYPYCGFCTPFFTTSTNTSNMPMISNNTNVSGTTRMYFTGTGGLVNTGLSMVRTAGTGNLSSCTIYFIYSPNQNNSNAGGDQCIWQSDAGYGPGYQAYDNRNASSTNNSAGGFYPSSYVSGSNYLLSCTSPNSPYNKVQTTSGTYYIVCCSYYPFTNLQSTSTTILPYICNTWIDNINVIQNQTCGNQDGIARVSLGCDGSSGTNMGADSSNPPINYFNGYMLEWIAFTGTHNTSERNSMFTFLRNKWNIPQAYFG